MTCISVTMSSIKLKSNSSLLVMIGLNCRSLRRVDLFGHAVGHGLSLFLYNVQSTVEHLSFTDCTFDDPLKLKGVRFPQLKSLVLNEFMNTAEMSAFIARCANLTSLSIRAARGVYFPTPPPTITVLVLDGTNHSAAVLWDILQSLPLLEVILLIGIKYDVDEALAMLMTASPLLRDISVQNCRAFYGRFCYSATKTLQRLRVEQVHHSVLGNLARVLNYSDQLQDLRLCMCSKGYELETHEDLLLAFRNARNLQFLDVGNIQLGPNSIVAIAAMPNLRHLGLRGASYLPPSTPAAAVAPIATAGIEFIAQHAPQLRTIHMCLTSGLFTALTCQLWKMCYPRIQLVTEVACHDDCWGALDFPDKPATFRACEQCVDSDSDLD